MDAKVPNAELFERLRQQHEAIDERLARTATRIGSVLDRLAAALARNVDSDAEDAPHASRAALAVSELRQETSQPGAAMAGAENDV